MSMVREDDMWLFIQLPISRVTTDISDPCYSAHDNLSVDPLWFTPSWGTHTAVEQRWMNAVALLSSHKEGPRACQR